MTEEEKSCEKCRGCVKFNLIAGEFNPDHRHCVLKNVKITDLSKAENCGLFGKRGVFSLDANSQLGPIF